MQRKLDVLYIKPNELPIKMTIRNNLQEKQKLVDGNIEYTYLQNCNDIALICNEEGKVLGLPFNRDIGHDIIFGNFIVIGDDPSLGEDRSLTPEQIEKYSKYFNEKSIENTDAKINEIINKSLEDFFFVKGGDYMMNQMVLIGRLAKDPEVKELEDGKSVSNITLAVSRSYKNSDGEYETDFISCVLWDGIAESTAEYCKKGDLIGIKGRIQTRSYTDEEENKKTVTEVVAEKVTFLSSKKTKDNDELEV